MALQLAVQPVCSGKKNRNSHYDLFKGTQIFLIEPNQKFVLHACAGLGLLVILSPALHCGKMQ